MATGEPWTEYVGRWIDDGLLAVVALTPAAAAPTPESS